MYQMVINPKVCTGCGICELACSLYNEDECNPERSRIKVVRDESNGVPLSTPIVCQQCESAACKEVCPTRAIYRDLNTNALVVNPNKCIGCKYCVNACLFGAMSFDRMKSVPFKCNVCSGKPACVELCPTDALQYVDDKGNVWRKQIDVYGLRRES